MGNKGQKPQIRWEIYTGGGQRGAYLTSTF